MCLRDGTLVPAAGTSQTCNACGHRSRKNRESQAVFRCKACGHTDNADANASRNVLAEASPPSGRGWTRPRRMGTILPKEPMQARRPVRRSSLARTERQARPKGHPNPRGRSRLQHARDRRPLRNPGRKRKHRNPGQAARYREVPHGGPSQPRRRAVTPIAEPEPHVLPA